MFFIYSGGYIPGFLSYFSWIEVLNPAKLGCKAAALWCLNGRKCVAPHQLQKVANEVTPSSEFTTLLPRQTELPESANYVLIA